MSRMSEIQIDKKLLNKITKKIAHTMFLYHHLVLQTIEVHNRQQLMFVYNNNNSNNTSATKTTNKDLIMPLIMSLLSMLLFNCYCFSSAVVVNSVDY